MLLAIGLNNEMVSANFGMCNDFRLVEIEDGKVVSTKDIFNDVNTHKQRPPYLKSLGVNALIMGGLGATAYDLLILNGVECIDGKDLSADEALEKFLNQELTDELKGQGPHCS